jgi:thiosulfate/3-mercaptopyruvate sulfurtransferase
VDVAELRQALNAPQPPTLLDVRWELGAPPGACHEQYLAAHIPGAAFVDLDRDLAAPAGAGGRHPLPAAEAFEAAMRRAGVSSDRPVVIYDGGASMAAARGWWVLRYFGHPAVAVLDGGLAAWSHQGGATLEGEERSAPGDFEAMPGAMPVLDATGAADLVRRGGTLIDARAAERFRGEVEPVDPVAGHIPGARNIPVDGLQRDGRLLDPRQLGELFEGAQIHNGQPLGAYCGSGVSAALEVLALELAGHRAALYPGSWSDWIADPRRARATGPD